MWTTVCLVSRKIAFIIFLASLFLLNSCTIFRHSKSRPRGQGQRGTKLAVAGFQLGLMPGQQPKAMSDPITGSIFMAEPVNEAYAEELSSALYRLLSERGDYTLIPLVEVGNIAMNLEVSSPKLLQNPKQLYAQVGKHLGADMVLVGYLYRWRERRGESYGVRRAASVAFSLGLISVKDRDLVWSGKFDKTQRSLAENLLDLLTFLRGKGRWMSAKELALMGLEKVVKDIPSPLRD